MVLKKEQLSRVWEDSIIDYGEGCEYVCESMFGGGAKIKQAELLADKMEEPGNQDWAETRENSFLSYEINEGDTQTKRWRKTAENMDEQ